MVEVYDSVLSLEECQRLIEIFEGSEKDTTHKMFQQVELEQSPDLVELVKTVGKHYFKKYDPSQMTPNKYLIEGFRIKKYLPNVHSFPWHIDAGTSKTCSRFLAFLFYLNDSEAGTKFSNFTVEAKCGNILVFPPMWMFPHEGIMPTKNPKYVMSTYFHYV